MLHFTWELALCAVCVLACVAASVYLIWRYEGSGRAAAQGQSSEGPQPRPPGIVYNDETWRTCFQKIDPRVLMVYRLVCSAMFTTLGIIAISRLHTLLYFYTWWTFLLATVYFWLATGMSIYGWRKKPSLDGQGGLREVAGFFGYLLQVLYQTTAGAVMFTDTIYWLIIFPNIIHKRGGDHVTFWNIMPHSFNFIFLLGDGALNSMRYPLFRIGYFLLWTSIYVIFQLSLHALSAMIWWPYPFLNVSSPWAPLWYVVAGLLQVPCYVGFMVALILKRRLFARWFPTTFIQV